MRKIIFSSHKSVQEFIKLRHLFVSKVKTESHYDVLGITSNSSLLIIKKHYIEKGRNII